MGMKTNQSSFTYAKVHKVNSNKGFNMVRFSFKIFEKCNFVIQFRLS